MKFKKKKSIVILVVTVGYVGLLIREFTKINDNCETNVKSTSKQAKTIDNSTTVNHSMIEIVGLLPDVVAQERRIAYYMWCDKRIFEFKNYLSVLSLIHFTRPGKLIFQYLHSPLEDRLSYNTWFNELQESVGIMMLDTSSLTADICRTENTKRTFMMQTLMKRGGIYMGRKTILLKPPPELDADFANHLYGSYHGYAIGQPTDDDFTQVTDMCPSSSDVSITQLESTPCIYEAGDIYPKHFWNKNDTYGAVVRTLMYGDSNMPEPISRISDLIPNIAHIMWVGGHPMDFLFYLCCLSLIYVVAVDNLYIHGEVPPSGAYWEKIKTNSRLEFIQSEIPNFVFNKRALRPRLMSDIFRSEVMIKYGGIYSDVDVIWTQALNTQIRSYDAVASLDWASAYYPYPNYINLGVSLGKRNAPFWRQFRQSLSDLRNDEFGFNGLLQPYKIYERNPSLLRLDNHLQVMCYMDDCHPLWEVSYKTIDWRKETHAFHWTWPTPIEFSNMSTLLNSTTVWAQMGQHVLRKAALL